MENLQPGQQLGPFRVMAQIGQGGMATVYKAHQASMDRYVALKVLPREFAHSAEFRARFAQEARLIANLEHAHILPIYDFGETDGVHYFVMRLLETGTLKERIDAKPLSLNEIDELFTQIVDALGYAHTRGIVHRDIKPSNVLVDQHGDAFLTDFGIAKIIEGSNQFSGTGAVTGTPDYMSPEQGRGEKLDQRSDIYSLGVVLYEMVTGRVPFQADTPLAVILKHMSAPLPPPSQVKPGTSPEIEKVILKALAKEKADRYASCSELIAAWKAAVQATQTRGQTASSVPQPTTTGAPPPVPAPNTFSGGAASNVPIYSVAPASSAPSSNNSFDWLPLAIFALIGLCLCTLVIGGAASIPFLAAALNFDQPPTRVANLPTEPSIPSVPTIEPISTVDVPAIPTIPALTPKSPDSDLATQVWEVGEEGKGEGQFNDARYLAVDQQGNIYVGEHQPGSRIQIFDADGNFVKQWQITSEAYLNGLSSGSDGKLYALLGSDVVVYSGETGELLRRVALRGAVVALAAGPDDSLYVATLNSILRLSQGSQPDVITDDLVNIADTAFVPEAIAVDSQGQIYVAGSGVFSVLKFSSDGSAVTTIGEQGHDPGQFYSSILSVAVDPRDYVYASASDGIQVYDSVGGYIGSIPGSSTIFGLVIQSRADQVELIMLDRNTARLIKYRLEP